MPLSFKSDFGDLGCYNEAWGIEKISVYIKLCHVSCETCTDEKETSCIKCALGFYLDEKNKKCVAKCEAK